MTVILRCPGVDSYGHGQGETTVHAASCCAQFALAGDEDRARIGLRIPVRTGRDTPMPAPPAPLVIGVPELISLVAELQRRASEEPDAEPDGVAVWLEIGPGDDFDEVMGLLELGGPYGLIAGWRRTSATR